MKTITVSDEVYRKLVALKRAGGRSFSQVIDELIRSRVDLRVERLIEESRRLEGVEEIERIVRELRERFGLRVEA